LLRIGGSLPLWGALVLGKDPILSGRPRSRRYSIFNRLRDKPDIPRVWFIGMAPRYVRSPTVRRELARELADVQRGVDAWATRELAGINAALRGKKLEPIVMITRQQWEAAGR